MNDLFTTPSAITVLVCILSAFVRRIFVDSHLPYSYCVVGFFAVDVDVDVVDLRAQADASMPASNNNVNYTI